MPALAADPPATAAANRPAPDLQAAARALGASGGGNGAAQLLQLLCDPEVETDAVLSCLRGEPALSARVLKVANSPYYRQSGQVGTVDRAVQLLGLTAIRGIAAAGCLDRAAPPRAGQAFEPEKFRRHSLAVACAAQQLSRAARLGLDGEAFMGGLLHDIGVLLLAKADAAAMAAFVPPELPDMAAGLAAERAHFGVDHQDAAAVLVEAWSLPAWLRAAMTGHHGASVTPPPDGIDALPLLLHLADGLAGRAGFPLWPVCRTLGVLDGPLPFGLDSERLEAVAQQLPEAVAGLSAST